MRAFSLLIGLGLTNAVDLPQDIIGEEGYIYSTISWLLLYSRRLTDTGQFDRLTDKYNSIKGLMWCTWPRYNISRHVWMWRIMLYISSPDRRRMPSWYCNCNWYVFMQQRNMARYERKKSNLESDIPIWYKLYLSHSRIGVGDTTWNIQGEVTGLL